MTKLPFFVPGICAAIVEGLTRDNRPLDVVMQYPDRVVLMASYADNIEGRAIVCGLDSNGNCLVEVKNEEVKRWLTEEDVHLHEELQAIDLRLLSYAR